MNIVMQIIPREIKQTLLEKCNQEDVTTLNIKYQKKKKMAFFIEKQYKLFRNRLQIQVANHFEVPFMSVLVTQKCTLRCLKCSDLIPYYKRPENFKCEKVLFYLKRFLVVVNHVHFLLLCGGETFLYPDLDRILEFCLEEKKIENIGIVTNGTVFPDENLCKILKNKKIRIRVSDYKCVREKRKKVVQYLQEKGIRVEDLKGQKWYDVGGFEKRGRNAEQLKEVFDQCEMNQCFEINGEKVIYCARQRGGELGLMPENPSEDYVSLKGNSRTKLRNALLHMYDKNFLMACNYCDGITRQSKRVTPGVQQ